MIETLAQTDAQLAEEIRMLLFVFEDIMKLDDRSVQLVLRTSTRRTSRMALRGVSEEVKQKILGNMSQRGAEMLLEEMEYAPPQRRSVVEEAQGRIVGPSAASRTPARSSSPAAATTRRRPRSLSSVAEAPVRAFNFDQLPPEPAGARPQNFDARAAAEDFLASARAEADDIRHQARAQGHAEGFEAGMAAAREELAPAASALAEALADIQRLRGETADVVEERAVELALRIAERSLRAPSPPSRSGWSTSCAARCAASSTASV